MSLRALAYKTLLPVSSSTTDESSEDTMWSLPIGLLLSSLDFSFASDVRPPAGVQVQLDAATVIGTTNGSVESFLGVPYAHPP